MENLQLLDELHEFLNEHCNLFVDFLWRDYELASHKYKMRAIRYVKTLAVYCGDGDWMSGFDVDVTSSAKRDFWLLRKTIRGGLKRGDITDLLQNCMPAISRLSSLATRIYELAHSVNPPNTIEFAQSVQQYIINIPKKPYGWGLTPHQYSSVEANYRLTLKYLECFTYLLSNSSDDLDQRTKFGALIISILRVAHANDVREEVDAAEMEEAIFRSSVEMSLKLSPFHNPDAWEVCLLFLSQHMVDSFFNLLPPTHAEVHVLGSSLMDLSPLKTLLMQKLSLIKAELFVMPNLASCGTFGEAKAFLTHFFKVPLMHMGDKEKRMLQLVQVFLRETVCVSEDMILESSLEIFKRYKAESLLMKPLGDAAAINMRSFISFTELLSPDCQPLARKEVSSENELNLEEIIAVYEEGSLLSFNNFIKSDQVVLADHLLGKLRKLLTNRIHTFLVIKDQVVALLRELEMMGSFLQDAKNTAICFRVIYEAEYIVDIFLRGDAPEWYLQLLVFNAIEEIISIKMQIIGRSASEEKPEEVIVGFDNKAKIDVDLIQNGYMHLEEAHYLKNGFQDEGAKKYWRNYVHEVYVRNSSDHWSDEASTKRAIKILKTIQFFYNTHHGCSDGDEQLVVQCHRRQDYLKWLHHVCEKDPQQPSSALSESFNTIGLFCIKFGDACNQLMKVPLPARLVDSDMFDGIFDLVQGHLMQRDYMDTVKMLQSFRNSVSRICKLMCRDQKRLQSLLASAVTVVSSIQQVASRNEIEQNLFPCALDMSRKVLASKQSSRQGSESFINLLPAVQNLAHIVGASLDLSVLDLILDEPDENFMMQGYTDVAEEKLIVELVLSFLRETGSLSELSKTSSIVELSPVILKLLKSEALTLVLGYNTSGTTRIDKILFFFKELVSSKPNDTLKDCVGADSNAAMNQPPFPKSIECYFEQIEAVYMRDLLWLFNNFPRSGDSFFAQHILENLRKFATNLPDAITFMKDKFQAFLRNLEFLSSFLNDGKNRDMELRVTFFLYAADYIVGMFIRGDGPLCYHQLILFIAIEGAEFMKAQILHLEMSEPLLQDGQLTLEHDASRGSSLLKTEEVVVGFDDHAKNIVELLETGSQKLQVVSIVGMGGIGKSTLAKKVYNTLLSKPGFSVCAGSSVSQVYRKKELLLEILGDFSVVSDDVKRKDDNELAVMVFRSLKGKRYLILLDDIWRIEHWNDLRLCFPDDVKGSRILFTTRDLSVAEQANTSSIIEPYFLPFLSSEQSWNLLQEKVFPGGTCPEKLHDVGRLIAEYCKGLPLAIVVIAGILEKMQEQKEEWGKIASHLRSRVAADEEAQFMGILELSFNHLPSYLKPCFLYLGSFLEDQEIPGKKLQWLWMGEGFIPKTDAKTLEETAGGYLEELINRSLIMESKRCSLGGVKTCRIHDMLRDLCLKKAKQENFMQLITTDSPVLVGMHYRVCFHSSNYFVQSKGSVSHVHSLLSTSKSSPSFEDFKLLRVLDMEHIRANVFCTSIKVLLCLNYLAVKGSIESIPESIAHLWNLQTLIVKGTRGELRVPSVVWSMASLRNVHIRPRACLSLSYPECENGNLTTCSSPILEYKYEETMLKRWTRLRKLRFVFRQRDYYIQGNDTFPAMEFLTQLESLNIHHIGKTFPYKFSFPLNLKKLALSKFCLKWEYMIEISKLLHLEVLKLLFKAFEGDVWDVSQESFPKLRVLILENLNLANWNAEDCSNSFPELERLVLRSCKKLEEVPSSLGDVATMKQIEVQWCTRSASNSVQPIYEQQLEYGNPNFDVAIIPSEWNFSRSS